MIKPNLLKNQHSPSLERGNTDADSSTISYHTTIPPPPLLAPLSLLGADERRKSPQLHFLLEFNLLAHYAKEMGHPTNRCPTLPELRNLIQLPRETTLLTTPPSASTATPESSIAGNKGLRTKFTCDICFRIWPLHSSLPSST
jgi:hypothetical protein